MEKLSRALQELYTPADPEVLARRTAELVRGLIPSEVVRYAELRDDGTGFENEYYTGRREDFERFRSAFNAHMDEQPVVEYYRRNKRSRVLRISDLQPDRQFRKTAIYNEFYRPMGISHQLTTALFSREGRCREIILDRDGRDFNRQEVKLLELFTPHLDQVFVNTLHWRNLQRENLRLRQTLDATGEGFLLTDAQGRIIYRSRKVDKLLALSDESSRLTPGRLSPRLKAYLDRMIFRQINPLSDGSGNHKLVLKHSRGRVIVRFASLPLHPGGRREFALIFKETSDTLSARPLRSLGLTPRQAEILRHIADGKTDHAIAQFLGISSRTVEKHLETVYRRLGVDNRVDAARRAFEVLFPGHH